MNTLIVIVTMMTGLTPTTSAVTLISVPSFEVCMAVGRETKNLMEMTNEKAKVIYSCVGKSN